jgi:hypothetical protein
MKNLLPEESRPQVQRRSFKQDAVIACVLDESM